MPRFTRSIPAALAGVPIALLYALLVRLTFAANNSSLLLSTMTCGFLFIVPIAMGAITVKLAPIESRRSIAYAIFAPWLSVFIVAVGSIALYLEAAVCILMAVPLFLIFSSLGGLFFRDKAADAKRPSQNAMLGIILLAPYIVTPFEMKIPEQSAYRAVETQIVINAPAYTVWENLVSIPPIDRSEERRVGKECRL